MGCQNDAGILRGDKLSPEAKNNLVSNIKDEITNGTNGTGSRLFSCGPNVEPIQGADKIDLADEKKFDGFHKNVLGLFEKIVNVLNVEGQFVFAPVVFDPIALAGKLKTPEIPKLKFPDEFLTYGIALPLLAPRLGIKTPVDLAKLVAQVPTILVPAPPTLNIPKLDIKVPDFVDLFNFSNFAVKLPKLFLDLALQMPTLFTQILTFNFDGICQTVFDSKLLGEFDSRSVMGIAVAKTLVQSIAECIVIAIVASTLGSASEGITGNLGRKFGYVPPI